MASDNNEEGDYSPENRASLVRCTCAYIKKLCNKLNLQLLPQCTALVYCHRFVRVQVLAQHDRFILGAACVFLAAKVEEDMRRLDEVAATAQSIHDFRRPSAVLASHSLQRSSSGGSGAGKVDRETIREIREKILLCERVLLHSLSFDVSVTHPHLHAFELLKKLRVQGGPKALSECRQVSWNFLNDGLFADVCIMFSPEEVAAASVLLAFYYLRAREDVSVATKRVVDAIDRELKDKRLALFDQDFGRLQSIMNKMLTVYEAPRPFSTSSPSSNNKSPSAASTEESRDAQSSSKRPRLAAS